MIAPEKISQFFPIFVPDFIKTCECIFVFSPIITSFSIIEYAPILILSSLIRRLLSTIEVR